MSSTHGIHLPLRSGIETGPFVSGQIDIYGHAVNMASRLAGLANPGDVMISEAVRDRLTPGLDADLVDLGYQMLKHVEAPIRVFRIAPQDMPAPIVTTSPTDLIPTIAFIPLNAKDADQSLAGIGDIICEELIRWMSPAKHFKVISRPSTAPFRHRSQSPLWIGNHLKAQFVVIGSYLQRGSSLDLELTCTDCVRQSTIWHETISLRVENILSGELAVIGQLVEALADTIANQAVLQVKMSELDSVENYNLLLAAIALINRLNKSDFEQAFFLLERLCQRLPQAALPYAWLGHWYNMKVQQGWSTDPQADSHRALGPARPRSTAILNHRSLCRFPASSTRHLNTVSMKAVACSTRRCASTRMILWPGSFSASTRLSPAMAIMLSSRPSAPLISRRLIRRAISMRASQHLRL